ncbi:MAG: hypothetical protein KJZ72_16765 [Anaerolineales bacterium]|nr:hypothetical protein [Anaerolineales bacterium]
MVIRRINVDYTLPDLYEPKRWMCGKCGLIFDYLFGPEEAGWPLIRPSFEYEVEQNNEEDVDEVIVDDELCPRCGSDFDEVALIPVIVSEFAVRPFVKTTYLVEDKAHQTVIENIALQLRRDIDVIPLGNSENVRKFFETLKSKNMLDKAYFMVDGDNKGKIFEDQERFIHLEKYCIENYLLDFEVSAAVFGVSPEELKAKILEDLKIVLIQSNNIFSLLTSILTVDHLTAATMASLDGSKILSRLLTHFGITVQDYVPKYLEECNRLGRIEMVFDNRLVDSLKI